VAGGLRTFTGHGMGCREQHWEQERWKGRRPGLQSKQGAVEWVSHSQQPGRVVQGRRELQGTACGAAEPWGRSCQNFMAVGLMMQHGSRIPSAWRWPTYSQCECAPAVASMQTSPGGK
jgi:hypothetical protein